MYHICCGPFARCARASGQVCTETFGAAPEVVIHRGPTAMATMPYVDSHLVLTNQKINNP